VLRMPNPDAPSSRLRNGELNLPRFNYGRPSERRHLQAALRAHRVDPDAAVFPVRLVAIADNLAALGTRIGLQPLRGAGVLAVCAGRLVVVDLQGDRLRSLCFESEAVQECLIRRAAATRKLVLVLSTAHTSAAIGACALREAEQHRRLTEVAERISSMADGSRPESVMTSDPSR
jgi:hypothetical protein